jgi:hypothetical protein
VQVPTSDETELSIELIDRYDRGGGVVDSRRKRLDADVDPDRRASASGSALSMPANWIGEMTFGC